MSAVSTWILCFVLVVLFHNRLRFKMMCTWKRILCHRSLRGFYVGICTTEAGLCSTDNNYGTGFLCGNLHNGSWPMLYR